MTGRMFVVLLRIPPGEPVGEIRLYAGNNTHSNTASWVITDGSGSSRWMRDGEWVLASLPWPNLGTAGTPDHANITSVRLRVQRQNQGDVTATVNVQAVGYAPDGSADHPNGIVSITFDDGYASDYAAVHDIMTPRGLRGTSFIIPDFIDSASGNFLTTPQLHEMAWVHRHDFQAHGQTSYPSLTPDEMRAEWGATFDRFATWGLGRPEHLAYHGGQNSATVTATAREYFVSARTIDSRSLESVPPVDPYRLRAMSSISSARWRQRRMGEAADRPGRRERPVADPHLPPPRGRRHRH